MPAVRTYLDYNASAPLLAAAREAMFAASALDGNASSVHVEGRRLRAAIERAREAVAGLVGAPSNSVVFTSGASEANATVLRSGFDIAIRADVEHDSVLAPIDASSAQVVALPVSADGVVSPSHVSDVLGSLPSGARAVLAVQLANNETGVIQPVPELAAMARARGVHVHCDAVQAPGRIDISFPSLGVDTLVLSSHKLGGPKGAGAIVVRDGAAFEPLIHGGGQERRRRAGTENVTAIAGFAAAVGELGQQPDEPLRQAHLRDRLEAGVIALTPRAVVIGAAVPRLPNTTAIAFPGHPAELLLIKLDLAGFAVSAGAACSSGKIGRSRVLAAMGIPPDLAAVTIRISIGAGTTEADVDRFLSAWRTISEDAANSRQRTDPTGAHNPIQSDSADSGMPDARPLAASYLMGGR